MKEREEWNKIVEKIVVNLSPVTNWLSNINKDNENYSWPDIVRAQRALQYLKLAELEIWSMQYENDPKRVDLYLRDEQIK